MRINNAYERRKQNNPIQDDNEITRVSVRFADEDLWLTQRASCQKYIKRVSQM